MTNFVFIVGSIFLMVVNYLVYKEVFVHYLPPVYRPSKISYILIFILLLFSALLSLGLFAFGVIYK